MGTGKTYSTRYLLDSNNSSGVSGQVLSTTSTGIDWVDSGSLPTGLWLKNGDDIYNSNSGGVGIGISSPQGKLDVVDTDTTTASAIKTLVLGGGTSTTGNGQYIQFRSSSNATLGSEIAGTRTGSGARSNLIFSTTDSTSVVRQRMVIDSAGNVGINVTGPSSKLEVGGAANIKGTVNFAPVLTLGTAGAINAVINTADEMFFNIDSDDDQTGAAFHFGHNSTQGNTASNLMIIKDSGNVGIGETSPDRRLVLDGLLGTAALEIKKEGDRLVYLGTGTSAAATDDTIMLLYHDDVIKVNVSTIGDSYFNGGNVGIGVTGPGYKLEVAGDAKADSLYLADTRYIANQIQSGYANNADNSDLWINYTGYQGGATKFRDFRVGDGKQNQIAFFDGSTRNVGIGTTTTEARLHVTTNTDLGDALILEFAGTSQGGPYQTFQYNEGSYAPSESGDLIGGIRARTAYTSGTYAGYSTAIEFRNDGSPSSTSAPGRIEFKTTPVNAVAPTERLRIDNSGVSTFYGNVYLAAASNEGNLFFGTADASYKIFGGGTYGYMGYDTGGYHRFLTSGTERLRIAADGVIQLTSGINGYLNTNSIGMEMDINRNPETGAFTDAALSHARIIMRGDTVANGGSNIKFVTSPAINTVGTTKMTISGAGDVGIGTTPEVAGPTWRTLFVGSTAAIVSRQSASGYDSIFANNYYVNASNADQVRVAAPSSRMFLDGDKIRFQNSPLNSPAPVWSERMRIDSSGNVGIQGSTSPFSKLQVGSNTFTGANGMYANSRVGISNHGILTGMMLASTYNDAAHPEYGLVFVQGPSTSSYNVWSLSPDGPAKGSGLCFNYQAQSANIHAPANTKIYFKGSTGSVGIGTTDPQLKLHVNGGGALFGDIPGGGSVYVSSTNGNTINGAYGLDSDTGDLWLNYRGYLDGHTKFRDTRIGNGKGSQIVLVDGSSGFVGIGVTSPDQPLEVAGTIKSTSIGAARLILNGDSNNTGDTGDIDGIIDMLHDGDPGQYGYRINTENYGGKTALHFQENIANAYTSRLYIDKDGNVGIGNNSYTPLYPLDVHDAITSGVIIRAKGIGAMILIESNTAGEAYLYQKPNITSDKEARFMMTAGTAYGWAWSDDGSGTPASRVKFMKLDQNPGTLTVKGDVIAYGTPSDISLKENIKPIDSALDKVMKLQGVTFDWKKTDSILELKEDIGFIAQDVQKVVPELIRENSNGLLSMRHQGVAPILLEAIKELKAEIDLLKSKPCTCNKCNCNA